MSAMCKIQVFRKCLVLFAIIYFFSVTPLSMALSEPQKPSMQVSTDKKLYERGDILTISGTVMHILERIPITIMIVGPDRNLVHIEQIDVASDGTFTIPLKVEGPLWRLPGEYTVLAQNGFKHISSQVTFEFEKEIVQSMDVISVIDKSSGQVFNVNYTITGGKVKNILLDQQDLTLVVKIESMGKGTISLQMPRLLIDAKTDSNVDESFLVLIEDDEISSFTEEKSDPNYRVLTIPFSEGDSKIEIIGTTVIPEFANVASLIFVTSVVATLVFSMLIKMKSGSRFYCE